MKELIDRGFDPDLKDNAGVTPRMLGQSANNLIKEHLGLLGAGSDAKEDGSRSDSDASRSTGSVVTPVDAVSPVSPGGVVSPVSVVSAVPSAVSAVPSAVSAVSVVSAVPSAVSAVPIVGSDGRTGLPPVQATPTTFVDVSHSEEPLLRPAPSAQPLFPFVSPVPSATSAQPLFPSVSPVPSATSASSIASNPALPSAPVVTPVLPVLPSAPVVTPVLPVLPSSPPITGMAGIASTPSSRPSSLNLAGLPRRLSADASDVPPPVPQRLSLQQETVLTTAQSGDLSPTVSERLERTPSVELTTEQSARAGRA